MTSSVEVSGRSLLVAASYVVLRRGDEVLLQRRQNTGYMDGFWASLAGHVDPYETALDAAVREAREVTSSSKRADGPASRQCATPPSALRCSGSP